MLYYNGLGGWLSFYRRGLRMPHIASDGQSDSAIFFNFPFFSAALSSARTFGASPRVDPFVYQTEQGL